MLARIEEAMVKLKLLLRGFNRHPHSSIHFAQPSFAKHSERADGAHPEFERSESIEGRRGFTLLELLIYLSLFSFFAVLLFGFFLDVHKNLEKSQKNNSNAISVQVALGLLKRDLLCASGLVKDWDFNQNVFKKKILNKNGLPAEISIGYTIDKKGMIRKEGYYDFKNGRWTQVTYAHVGCEINDLKFLGHLKSDSLLSGVNIEYIVSKRKISLFVCLRNRVLP